MALDPEDRDLLAALQDGLPLVSRPFAEIARAAGISERGAIDRVRALVANGTIKRFGIVVRHHELGYRANAMVVWDVDDARAREAGPKLARLPYVTLAYRRARALPHWPYALYAMIHGRDRARVEALIEEAARAAALEDAPRAVLFSLRRFKQRGAHFRPSSSNDVPRAVVGGGPL